MDAAELAQQPGAQQLAGCPPDWHPADILAALKKRGYSLAGLSKANGYHPTAAGKALVRSWPAMEALIANAVGVTVQEIWPSRYTTDPEGPSIAPPKRRRRSA
jgi:Ner family transcriptional regulator